MRSWEMYGHQVKNGVWVAIGDKRFVERHRYGVPPVPVTVVEDSDGEYMGWIYADEAKPRVPVMIQYRRLFNMQFAYGYKVEEKRGLGEAIRLSIIVREEAEDG